MRKRMLLCALFAALFALSVPLAAFAAPVGELTAVYSSNEMLARAEANEALIKRLFPKLRSVESKETRFVFASAPEAVKTRAVLNKKGETLTFYRVGFAGALDKCRAMIKGNSLLYGGRTVYVDTLFPATYYYSAAENIIALYCGADAAADKILRENAFVCAGGIGGYFADRSRFTAPDGTVILTPPKGDVTYPHTLKELSKAADSVYVVQAASVPKWEGGAVTGRYELVVTQNVRGIERQRFFLGDYPYVMLAGRTYVLFIRHAATDTGGTRVLYADEVNHPAFELDDRGYVLPIRAYGMKAPVKLQTFLKSL